MPVTLLSVIFCHSISNGFSVQFSYLISDSELDISNIHTIRRHRLTNTRSCWLKIISESDFINPDQECFTEDFSFLSRISKGSESSHNYCHLTQKHLFTRTRSCWSFSYKHLFQDENVEIRISRDNNSTLIWHLKVENNENLFITSRYENRTSKFKTTKEELFYKYGFQEWIAFWPIKLIFLSTFESFGVDQRGWHATKLNSTLILWIIWHN